MVRAAFGVVSAAAQQNRDEGVLWATTWMDRTITVNVKKTDTIEAVKAKIHEAEGIPPEFQKVMHRGRQVHDDVRVQVLMEREAGQGVEVYIADATPEKKLEQLQAVIKKEKLDIGGERVRLNVGGKSSRTKQDMTDDIKQALWERAHVLPVWEKVDLPVTLEQTAASSSSLGAAHERTGGEAIQVFVKTATGRTLLVEVEATDAIEVKVKIPDERAALPVQSCGAWTEQALQ